MNSSVSFPAGAAGAVLDRFAGLDSTAVSDALESVGLPPGFGDLKPVWGSPKIVGYASTVQLEPWQPGPLGAHIGTHTVAAAGQRTVIVVANDGRTDVSCWGGLLSLGATRNGVRGVLADGVCRDVGEAEELSFPVFSRGATPTTARGRLQEAHRGQPVTIAGVQVAQDDIVIADRTGVAIVPRGRADEVLAAAEQVAARERSIAADLRAGRPLPQAMRDARLAGAEAAETAESNENPSTTEILGTDRVRGELAALSTASISDALDSLKLPGSLHGIGALRDGPGAVGQAFTVQYEPVTAEQPGTVGDFLDDVVPGSMVVIDNAGRSDCTVWGGIMTRLAAARGVAGTVIRGTCRDVPIILEVGYPMWSSARFMRTGKDRVQLCAVQVALHIDGVTIRPGDWVCADDDGALVVPADRAREVIEIAQRIERTGGAITAAVLTGATLGQARAEHGYHTLQTPAAGPTDDRSAKVPS